MFPTSYPLDYELKTKTLHDVYDRVTQNMGNFAHFCLKLAQNLVRTIFLEFGQLGFRNTF